MDEHILALLVWITHFTSYTIPTDPHLTTNDVSSVQMAQIACHMTPEQVTQSEQTEEDQNKTKEFAAPSRKACPVLGLYIDEKDELDIRDDIPDDVKESVEVHELTHFLQHYSGKFDLKSCNDTYQREVEAFRVQNLYIRMVQNKFQMYMPPPNMCPPEKN